MQQVFFDHFLLILIAFGMCFRTKTEPPIYYLPTKPLHEDATILEQQKEQVSSLPSFLRHIEKSGIILEEKPTFFPSFL